LGYPWKPEDKGTCRGAWLSGTPSEEDGLNRRLDEYYYPKVMTNNTRESGPYPETGPLAGGVKATGSTNRSNIEEECFDA